MISKKKRAANPTPPNPTQPPTQWSRAGAVEHGRGGRGVRAGWWRAVPARGRRGGRGAIETKYRWEDGRTDV